MEEHSVDVLVIGSGAAGLRAAIAASEGSTKVLLLSKSTAGLATATIISYGAFASSGFGLSIEEHIRKTIETGHNENDPLLVKILAEEAPERIWELRHRGVQFRETPYGVVSEGRFPVFGRQTIESLLTWAKDVNVRIISWVTAVSLIVNDGRAAGCVGVSADGKAVVFRAKAVVLCTGGASALFKFHDNPVTNIGDGYAMASRCGVKLRNMEFIQFYPLLINEQHRPRILAPPSLVEKGKVVNDEGEDIIGKYGLSDLRPVAIRGRDKLSAALYQEMMQGRAVFLDIRGVNRNDVALEPADRAAFEILEARYQSGSKPLPVMPCAHFTIGGVLIDEHCRTTMEGLFAAGEAACGTHGANRMGGNALTETLVFGHRAGNAAAAFSADCKYKRTGGLNPKNLLEGQNNYRTGRHRPSTALRFLQSVMWQDCGPVRDSKRLSLGLKQVDTLREEGICCDRPENLGFSCAVRNSLDTARMIIVSAIERKESLGAHYRLA